MQGTVLQKSNQTLLSRFNTIRKRTESICKSLAIEDYSAQPVVDVSPPKWHLAHTTWFFEEFVLIPHLQSYKPYRTDFSYLFNSYYNHAGDKIQRPNRGMMTRPTVDEVYDYRTYVEKHIQLLLEEKENPSMLERIELGLNHEEQHQELLIYDIKYILGHQPSFPSIDLDISTARIEMPMQWIPFSEGIYTIGYQGDGFSYDNELGVHKVYLHDYEIANRLVTNEEYIDFIEAGGYENFDLWHADGWDYIQSHHIKSPFYWHQIEGKWLHYQTTGLCEVDPHQPVMHVSYYEAFAFAEWKGFRLPTEFEWEQAAAHMKWGQLWEWTSSAYLPYPGFQKAPGALGEYNGKFMVNQQVLRGASVATSQGHSRVSYRNFFHPQLRWMYSGIRLAKSPANGI